MLPQVYHDHGSCPHDSKNLFGREIQVSFFGPTPFIFFSPISGSDFNLAKLLAKKHNFKMGFIPAKTADESMHRVSNENNVRYSIFPAKKLLMLFLGFKETK